MAKLFPNGVAFGEAFYDRTQERKQLKQHLKHGIHTVLIAPRRFGKTSLMTQVLLESKSDHLWMDLMTITSCSELQLKLVDKVSELVVKLLPAEDKLKAILGKYFFKLSPEIKLTIPGVELKLHPHESPHLGITEALMELDRLATELNKRLVVVLDEFQEITRFEQDGTALQAAIRHAAERAQSITYFFSGSRHRPLKRLFNGKENPLYELCFLLNLDKVSAEDYTRYLNSKAKERWGYPLNKGILSRIFEYTERFPRYVNALCGALWLSELEPTIELVDEIWQKYLFSRKGDMAEEVGNLTLNQRRLLQFLAFSPTEGLFNRETLSAIGLSQGSIQVALEALLDKGLVSRIENVYHVLDPTYRAYFDLF